MERKLSRFFSAPEKPFTVVCLYRHGGAVAPTIASSVVKGLSGEKVEFGKGKWEHDTSVRHWLKKVPVKVIVRGLKAKHPNALLSGEDLEAADLVIADLLHEDNYRRFLAHAKREDLKGHVRRLNRANLVLKDGFQPTTLSDKEVVDRVMGGLARDGK